MDLTSARSYIVLIETQFQASGASQMANVLGEVINFLIDNLQNHPIGTPIPSLLTQTQFQSFLGSNWLLCNGQSCSGSAYQTLTGHATVPDMRARYPRGKNNGRSDGKENQNGELALGTLQSSNYGTHTHPATFSHNTAKRDTTPFFGQNPFDPTHPAVRFAAQNSGQSLVFDIHGPTNLPTGSLGDENPTTGSEVRPRSIVVNFFMRIN